MSLSPDVASNSLIYDDYSQVNIQARLLILENQAEQILAGIASIADKQRSFDDKLDKFNERLWSGFYWFMGTLFGCVGMVFSVLGHQFH